MKDLKKSLSTLRLSKEQLEMGEEILDLTDEVCKKEIEPHSRECDKNGARLENGTVIYPEPFKKAIQKIAEIGILGLPIPEEYEGLAQPTPIVHAVTERIARADASFSLVPMLQATVADMIVEFGSEELKEKYLPDIAKGKRICGLLYTEPTSGSDLGSLKTKAVDEGKDYVINGTKIFISNAGVADVYAFLASTDPSKGSKGLTAFIFDTKETDGFEIVRLEDKLGLHASPTGQIFLNNARVSKENMLGELNRGFRVVLYGLTASRIGVAAQAVGIADAAYRKAATYVAQREQFGRKILDFQVTQFKLADMATQIFTARQMYMHAAMLKFLGQEFREEACMAKVYASEMAQRVTYEALQLHGGYGYVADYDVERYYRDARITAIYEGTSEVQRIVISREEMAKIPQFAED